VSYELLQVPGLVDDVLGPNLTVTVDVRFGFGAVKYLALAHGEQFVAIGTFVKVITFFLQQQLQLLHEQTRYKLVLAFLQQIEPIEGHFASHVSDNLRIDAAHVDLDLGDLLDVLDEVLEALFD